MENYILFLVVPPVAFVVGLLFFGVAEVIIPRLTVKLFLYDQLDNVPISEEMWEHLEAGLAMQDAGLERLIAMTTVLGGRDEARLVGIYEKACGDEAAALNAFRVILGIQANPQLRRYLKPFIEQLSIQMREHTREPLEQLQSRIATKLREAPPRRRGLLAGSLGWTLNKTVAVSLLLLGFIPFIVFVLGYLVAYRSLPITKTMRLGRLAKDFGYYELSTCRVDEKTDERLRTPAGRFLTATGVYNYLGYWNVLLGNMNLVGPYPVCCYWPARIRDSAPERFFVKPGLTGKAQLTSYERSLTWDEFLSEDVWYVSSRSLKLDVGIFLQSVARLGEVLLSERDASVFDRVVEVAEEQVAGSSTN